MMYTYGKISQLKFPTDKSFIFIFYPSSVTADMTFVVTASNGAPQGPQPQNCDLFHGVR